MGINTFFKKADEAKIFWLNNSLDQYRYILLLPHWDKRLNLVMCNAFEKKLRKEIASSNGSYNKPNALVLSVDNIKASDLFISEVIAKEMADSLITLYSMYEFTDKLIIGSFDLPYGRMMKNLLECNIDSEKGLLSSIIF